jgi:hypothetical protein
VGVDNGFLVFARGILSYVRMKVIMRTAAHIAYFQRTPRLWTAYPCVSMVVLAMVVAERLHY